MPLTVQVQELRPLTLHTVVGHVETHRGGVGHNEGVGPVGEVGDPSGVGPGSRDTSRRRNTSSGHTPVTYPMDEVPRTQPRP